MILYRLILWLPLTAYAALRALRSRVSGGTEALARPGHVAPGQSKPGTPDSPRLWLHAASNGELASARAIIAALLARDPGLSLVITTNSGTGRNLAQSWHLPRAEVTLAPIDLRGPLKRFLAHWAPVALITVENELWPERFHLCQDRDIPVFLVGARLSAGSHRFWRRVPGLARQMLDAITYLSAQDPDSEARFRDLGLGADRIGPVVMLKSALTPAPTAATLAYPRAVTLLAASTHPGEEEIVLQAFAAAHRANPGLRLILAPRHARRGREVAALITRHGFGFATRSAGEAPASDTPVFLADTMGEMDRWYAAAGLCLTGGSLVDHGGHTPFEPAAHGAAILHGPFTANFAPAYHALADARATVEVNGTAAITAALLRLTDPAEQARMAAAATSALAAFANTGGLARFYGELARATNRPALAVASPRP